MRERESYPPTHGDLVGVIANDEAVVADNAAFFPRPRPGLPLVDGVREPRRKVDRQLDEVALGFWRVQRPRPPRPELVALPSVTFRSEDVDEQPVALESARSHDPLTQPKSTNPPAGLPQASHSSSPPSLPGYISFHRSMRNAATATSCEPQCDKSEGRGSSGKPASCMCCRHCPRIVDHPP